MNDTKNNQRGKIEGVSLGSGMSKPADISKPLSIVDQIYRDLVNAIVEGRLMPGQLLTEREFQEWFGVSKAPIREAMRLLEADELVIVDAFKKKYIRRLTRDYLKDIFPLAACLEGFAARLAAEHITEERINILERIDREMEKSAKVGSYAQWADLNSQFHGTIVRISENTAVRRALKSVSKKIIWFWITQIYYRASNLIPLSIAEHKKIIKAFCNGDPEGIEKEVREHIMNVFNRFMEVAVFDEEGDLILS